MKKLYLLLFGEQIQSQDTNLAVCEYIAQFVSVDATPDDIITYVNSGDADELFVKLIFGLDGYEKLKQAGAEPMCTLSVNGKGYFQVMCPTGVRVLPFEVRQHNYRKALEDIKGEMTPTQRAYKIIDDTIGNTPQSTLKIYPDDEALATILVQDDYIRHLEECS